MITWTIVEDKIYVISYSARYGRFMKYLSLVEEMIQSFQPADSSETVSNNTESSDAHTEQGAPSSEDPVLIPKRRFA